MASEHSAIVYLWDEDVQRHKQVAELVAHLGYEFVPIEDASQLAYGPRVDCPGCLIASDRVIARREEINGRPVTSFLELSTGGRVPLSERGMSTIILCEQPDVEKIVRFMRAGAINVLPTPLDCQSLATWIEEAIAVDRVRISQEERLLQIRRVYNSLSERKRSVLQHMIDGRASKWSAHVLDVSRRTIELDRAEILRLFGASNAIELARMVTENKCLPLNFSLGAAWESSAMSYVK